jgi:hypothetical protein
VAGTGLTNRGAWVTSTSYVTGDYVFSTGSVTDTSMWILQGASPYVSTTLPNADPTHWVEFAAPAGPTGPQGPPGAASPVSSVAGRVGAVVLTTTDLSNFAAASRAVPMTGLSLATATAVVAADTELTAVGKLQAQITALTARVAAIEANYVKTD